MKLISDKNTRVESIGTVGVEHEFRMEASSKAFDIIIDKLYTNKIAAVIRELSTNAYESHVMSKISDTPFLVKLPNELDSNFSVRDYGQGLSEDEIYNLYTVVFKSTKSNTNEVGGSFGIGSKVGFAYTKNFIVSSYQNGVKNVYAIYKNEKGIPSVQKMVSINTDEPNGLEVVVPVQRSDIYNFKVNATEIYRWFDTLPKVVGQTVSMEQPRVKFAGNGWKIVDNSSNYAIMGNVAYKIDVNYGYTGLHKELLSYNSGILLYFNISEIEPEPSRESISFNKETIRAIESRLKLIKDEFERRVQDEINSCVTYWEAYHKLQESNKLTWFHGNCTWNGKTLGPIKLDFKLPYRYSYTKSERETELYTNNPDDKFVVIDKKQTVGAIKEYVKYNGRVYLARSVTDADEYSKKMLIEQSSWVLSSTLPKPASNGRNSRTIQGTVLKLRKAYSNQGSWEDETTLDLDKESGLFVQIFRNKIKVGERLVDPQVYYKLIKELKIIEPIYGIKPVSIEQFKQHKNWKCGLEAVNKAWLGIKGDIDKYYANNYIESQLSYGIKIIIEKLAKMKDVAKLTDNLFSITSLSDNVKYETREKIRSHSAFTGIYSVDEDTVPTKETKEIVTKIKDFMKKYPLIANCSSISSIPEEDVVNYVKSKLKEGCI